MIRAHEGHAHKVRGTVSAITAKQLEVKTPDGKTVAIALDAKTVYRHGKAKADLQTLKVGERVVVDAVQEEGAKAMTATPVVTYHRRPPGVLRRTRTRSFAATSRCNSSAAGVKCWAVLRTECC